MASSKIKNAMVKAAVEAEAQLVNESCVMVVRPLAWSLRRSFGVSRSKD
jgi:hypothetical protein